MVPFKLHGMLTVETIAPAGDYPVDKVIATLKDAGGKIHEARIMQSWPVKLPIKCYSERMRPTEPLVTQQRIIDALEKIDVQQRDGKGLTIAASMGDDLCQPLLQIAAVGQTGQFIMG